MPLRVGDGDGGDGEGGGGCGRGDGDGCGRGVISVISEIPTHKPPVKSDILTKLIILDKTVFSGFQD